MNGVEGDRMKLGMLVNTDRHANHIAGIARASVSLGYEVIIFIMDDGTKLLTISEIAGLSMVDGIEIIYCELNAKQLGVKNEGLPVEIVPGGQYNNAVMNHVADRVIVL